MTAQQKHRNRKTRRLAVKTDRNPVTDHTIDDDMADLREYAAAYIARDGDFSKTDREVINMFIIPDQKIEFYHGLYVGYYQSFTMLMNATDGKEMAMSIQPLIYAVAHKIVSMIDARAQLRDQSAKFDHIPEAY